MLPGHRALRSSLRVALHSPPPWLSAKRPPPAGSQMNGVASATPRSYLRRLLSSRGAAGQ